MSSYKDQEKTDTYPAESKYSTKHTKQTTYSSHQCIAMSPDGTQIALLNTSTYQLKLCKFNNLSNVHIISYDKFKHNVDISLTKLHWSLSVSNEITLPDGTVDVLIAVSCFDDENMKVNSYIDEIYSKNDKNEQFNASSTWIISSKHQTRVSSSIDNIGGIIKVLNNKDDNTITNVVVINAKGITKSTIIHEELKTNDNSWLSIFQIDRLKNLFNFLQS